MCWPVYAGGGGAVCSLYTHSMIESLQATAEPQVAASAHHSKGCSSSSSATPGRVGKFMAQGEGCSPKGGEALALAEEIQPSHRKVQHRETVGVEALHRGGQALPDHRHEVGDVVLEQQRRGILAEQ